MVVAAAVWFMLAKHDAAGWHYTERMGHIMFRIDMRQCLKLTGGGVDVSHTSIDSWVQLLP